MYLADKNGERIARGSTVVSFRDEIYTVVGWEEPLHSGSTGRVYVTSRGNDESAYYPSVFNLHWVK